MSRGRQSTPRRKAPSKGRPSSKRASNSRGEQAKLFTLFALTIGGLGILSDLLQVRDAVKELEAPAPTPGAVPLGLDVLVDQPTKDRAVAQALHDNPGTVASRVRRSYVITLQRKAV